MTLLDNFYLKPTGISIHISPICLKEISEFYEAQRKDNSLTMVPERSIFNYASAANLFSGGYSLLFDLRDNGSKPVLSTREVVLSSEVIPGKIILPQEIKKSSENGFSCYSPKSEDWNPFYRSHPVIFCSIPLNGNSAPARLYFENKKGKSLIQTLAKKGETMVRDNFSCRMYDVELVKSLDRFTLQEWEV